jgi:hypothetical protein
MSSKDIKSSLSDNIDNHNDKDNTMSINNTDNDTAPQNVNNSNNNNTNANASSLVDNNANNVNKDPQTTRIGPPNTPKENLAIDDMNMKNSLLKEINRIDNWANVA